MQSLTERQARYRAIKKERAKGKTNAEIGRLFGLTRQRVNTILKNGEPRPNGRPPKQQEHTTA
jgi:DNA-binding CsgD family transcriptional regulator